MKNNEIWSPPKITLLVTTARFAVPETTATRSVIQIPPGTAMVAITRPRLVIAVLTFSATSGGIFFLGARVKLLENRGRASMVLGCSRRGSARGEVYILFLVRLFRCTSVHLVNLKLYRED